MKKLLIVYHTQSGTCAQLAAAACAGARREEGVAVSVLRAWDASVSDLAAADGLLLIAAENAGALCGAMKDFLDRTFYPALDRQLIVPHMLLVSAGNDGRGAAAQAERILSGYPFPPVAATRIVRGAFQPEHAVIGAEAGQAFAAGLVMGIY